MLEDIAIVMKEEEKVVTLYDAIDFMTNYVNGLSQLLNVASVDNKPMFYQIMTDVLTDASTYKQKNHYKSRFEPSK